MPCKKAIFLLIVLPLVSCSKLDRVRQMRTFTDMQTITAEIETIREEKPDSLNDYSQIQRLVSTTSGGRDAWHHRYLFLSRPSKAGLSYILVSMGSDGKSEVVDPKEYFTMREHIIHDEPWRDIVFRDGRPITLAGK